MDLERLIDAAEQEREQGRPSAALAAFRQAFGDALNLGRKDLALKALSHEVVCYQLLYERETDPKHLLNMVQQAENGLKLAQAHGPEEYAHIFQFRLGVAQFQQGNYLQASQAFYQALCHLPSTGATQYPEYSGYYGCALVLSGDDAGLGHIQHAEHMAGRLIFPPDQQWRRSNVLCGIQQRKALAAKTLQLTELSEQALDQAEKLAHDVYCKAGFSERLRQVKKLRQYLHQR